MWDSWRLDVRSSGVKTAMAVSVVGALLGGCAGGHSGSSTQRLDVAPLRFRSALRLACGFNACAGMRWRASQSLCPGGGVGLDDALPRLRELLAAASDAC